MNTRLQKHNATLRTLLFLAFFGGSFSKTIKTSFLMLAFMLLGVNGWGQVNISAGNTVTENFTLGTSATATLPTGWKADKNTTVRSVGSYSGAVTATENRAGNSMSTSAANGIYNYAAGDPTTATERAIGGISSGSAAKSVNTYVQLTNNGAVAITSFDISYGVEKYRKGSNTAGFSIQMYYSTNGTSWTSAGSDFLTSFVADTDNTGYTSAPGATSNVTNKTLTVTIAASSSIYLAWNYSVTTGTTTSNAQALGIDDVSITAIGSATPTITTSTTSLTGFTYVEGSGPSTEQSFTISGSNLTDDIDIITGYDNYLLSTTLGGPYTTSLTLIQSGGTVANTTIYVILKTGLTQGTYADQIVCGSTGAVDNDIDVDGTVTAAGATTCLDEGFDAGTAAPTNWTFTSIGGVYTSVGNFGASSPSLQMDATGDAIETPTVSGASELSFWIKGQGTNSFSALLVEGYDGSSWVTIENITNSLPTTGTTKTYNASSTPVLPTGLTKFRFTYTKSGGNLSFDDVKVICGTYPTVSVIPSTLTGFTYVQGSGPSTSQSFSLSGADMTGYPGNITVAGSANYEVSLDNSTFSSSVSVPFTSGTLTATLIYVRLKTGLTSGNYNSESISISGGGDTNGASVVCSGNVTILVSEINLKGNGNSIANGDVSPQGTDHTSFGTAIVGSTTIDRTFTIENTGTAVLNLTGSMPNYVTISGANASDFTVFTQPTTPIAATSTTTFVVRFNPTAAGTRLATVNIANDDSDENPYTFAIQGTGNVTSEIDMVVKGNGVTIPDNDIYPQGTDHTAFGTALLGSTIDRTFTIVNNGTNNLNLTGTPLVKITGAGAAFFSVITQPGVTTIAGGSSTTFVVRFTAGVIGTKTANIEIVNNDPDNSIYNFYISGTGKGTEKIYVYGQNGENIPKGSSASTLNHTNFGGVAITGGLVQKVYTIYNYSGGSMSISNLVLSGANASLFSITSYPSISINDNSNTQFSITFDPDIVGEKVATITFDTSLTSPDNTFSFGVGGTGIDFTPCSLNVVETIVQQDFEDLPATPIWSYTTTSTGALTIAGGTFNNGSGEKNAFLGAKSLQFKGIGTDTPYENSEILFDAVNTQDYENINLTLRVGAFRGTSTQGLDVNDIVYIQTSTDGGTNWSTEAILGGYSNSRWDYTTTGEFNAFYSGNNNAPKIDTRPGNAELTGVNGISTINLKDLPAVSSLLIKIVIEIEREDEIFAIDNVVITGQKPEVAKWIASSGGSWQSGITPASGKKVIFDDDFDTTTDGDVTACSCQVNAGKIVNVRNGDYLNIASDILNEGTIIVESQGQIVQQNDNAVISDLGIFQIYKTTGTYFPYDYIYWSSPVEGLNIQDVFSSSNGFNGYKYKFAPSLYNDTKSGIRTGPAQTGPGGDGFDDNGDDWTLYSSGTMDKGLGYIVMGKGSPLPFNPTNITPQSGYTVNFTSQKVNNGLVDVVLYRDQYNITNGVSDSYNINLNLVGNPYPSAISTVELYNDNSSNIEPKFYFWTHEHPISNTFVGPWGYNFSNNSIYSATVSGSTVTTVNPLGNNPLSLDYTYIASGQAFLVQAKNGITSGTTQLNFNNSMRNVTNPNISFLKSNNDDSLNRIWLSMTEINGDKNFIALGFGANNTDELSLNDVYRMDSGNDTEFYSLIPQVQGDFDIQFLSEFSDDKTIPLGMEIRAAGSYAIQIEQAEGVFLGDQKIYLEDTYLDIIHEMGMGPYTFTQTVGENINDRFILRFTNSALGNEETVFNQVKVYPNPSTGVFNVSYQGSATLQYTVYDLTGKTVLTGSGNQINLSQQAIGLYVAKITDGTAVRTLKLVRE